MKKIIPSVIIIALLTGIILASYYSGRTVSNEEGAIGNTAANLLNGGLFCENDGKIYFSNPNDEGSLYVMDSDMQNIKKLSSDNSSYINVTNHYIIYVRDNHARSTASGQFLNFNTVGIFRIDKKDGDNVTQLYGKAAGLTSLYGNTVYYQHYNADEGLQFYQVDIDRENERQISEEPIAPASFLNGKLYYNGVDNEHDIHTMDLESNTVQTVLSGNCYNVVATSSYLYFLALDENYAIARTNLDGSDPTILVDERCSFYNLTADGNYLYYQIDGGDNNRLCRMNLSTMESKTLKEGDYNSIHDTDHYVFFREFDSEDTYYLTKTTGEIERFNPPVLDN